MEVQPFYHSSIHHTHISYLSHNLYDLRLPSPNCFQSALPVSSIYAEHGVYNLSTAEKIQGTGKAVVDRIHWIQPSSPPLGISHSRYNQILFHTVKKVTITSHTSSHTAFVYLTHLHAIDISPAE